MAGMNLKVNVDDKNLDSLIAKLQQLKREKDALTSQLIGTNQAVDPKLFTALSTQLQRVTKDFDALGSKLSKYVAEQEAAKKATQNTSSGLSDMQSLLMRIGGTTAIIGLGKQVMDVRNQFQQLEIAFGTMLKSSDKAAILMKDLTKFAATTPFGLQSAASGAKQLIAYGSTADTVIKELTMLGDVAAGTGQQIGDLVYLYGTLRTQGRAYLMDIRQFAGRGIPIYDELAKVLNTSKDKVNEFVSAGKVGFKEVEQAFKNMTSQGGLYGGLMEEQSKSIGGRMEALKDNISSIFNQIGKDSEGFIYKSIDGINTLVENYDKVGKILVGLVATYGTYKTAVILAAVAESGWTVTQMAHFRALVVVEKAQKLLNATMMKNPYVLAATVLVGLVTTIWALNDGLSESEKAMQKANDAFSKGEASAISEQKELSRLRVELERTTVGSEKYNKVKQEIVDKFGKYLPELDREITKVDTLATTYDRLTIAIRKSSLARAKDDALKNISDEYKSNVEESLKNIRSVVDEINASDEAKERLYRDIYDAVLSGNENIIDTQTINRLNSLGEKRGKANKEEYDNEVKSLSAMNRMLYKNEELYKAVVQAKKDNQKLSDEQAAINKLFPDDLGEVSKESELAGDNFKSAADKYNEAAKKYKQAKSYFDGVKANKDIYSAEEWTRAKEEYEAAKKELEEFDGKAKSDKQIESAADKMRESSLKLLNLQSELDSESVKQQLEHEQKLLDIEQDSFDKRYRQNQLNASKEFLAVEEYRQKMAKAQQEAAKDIYVKNNGSDKGFNYATFDKNLLPQGLKDSDIESQVKKMTDAWVSAWKKANDDLSNEMQAFINEERLTFASELDKQIYSIRSHYKERRLLAKGNSDAIKLIDKNEVKDIAASRLQNQERMLQADSDYNQKYLELVSERYVFESDKRKEALLQQINDEKKIFNNLEKQVLNDPNNTELANKLRDSYLRLQSFNKELKKMPANKFKEVLGYVDSIASAFSGMNEEIDAASELVSSFAQGLSQGGPIGGVISFGLTAISMVAKSIVSSAEEERRIKAALVKFQQDYNIALRQQNMDLINSVDYARAFRNNMEALKWLIDKGFISDIDYSAFDALFAKFDMASKNISDAQKNLDAYEATALLNIRAWANSISGYSSKAKEVLNEIEDGSLSVLQALQKMQALGFDGFEGLIESLQKSNDEVNGLTDELAELSNQLDEFATGNSFDGFLDDAMSAIVDMKSGISDLGSFTEDTLKNAVLSSFKYKILADALKPMYDSLADLFLADTLDKNAVKIWGEDLEKLLTEYGVKLEDVYKSLGLDFKDSSSSSQQASRGGFETMSQDTATALEGRFTSMQMRLITIDENVARIAQWNQPIGDKFNFDSMAIPMMSLNESSLRIERMIEENRNIAISSYYELKDINKNTNELYQMNERLGNIEKNTKGLISSK